MQASGREVECTSPAMALRWPGEKSPPECWGCWGKLGSQSTNPEMVEGLVSTCFTLLVWSISKALHSDLRPCFGLRQREFLLLCLLAGSAPAPFRPDLPRADAGGTNLEELVCLACTPASDLPHLQIIRGFQPCKYGVDPQNRLGSRFSLAREAMANSLARQRECSDLDPNPKPKVPQVGDFHFC